jgi:hypothetical protein
MKCVGNGTGMRITEMCTRFLVKEPDGEKPLGETRCRWEDNIKVAFKVIEFDVVVCVHVTELRHRWWAVYNMVVIVRIA